MLITSILQGRGKRFLVYGEDGFLFSLYGRELKRYHIEEGCNLSEQVISSIEDEIIFRRAKERALYLIERAPMPEKRLCDKLRAGDYSENVIERVVEFLKRYQYLDDSMYIRMYVEAHGFRKSLKQMRYDLFRKGISKNRIDEYFELHPHCDESGFPSLFERYVRNRNLEDYRERQKVFRYFYGKGYASSLIQRYIRIYQERIL